MVGRGGALWGWTSWWSSLMCSANTALLVNLQQEPMTSLAVFTLPLRWRCSVALQEVGLKVKACSGAPVEGSQGSGEDSVPAGPFK